MCKKSFAPHHRLTQGQRPLTRRLASDPNRHALSTRIQRHVPSTHEWQRLRRNPLFIGQVFRRHAASAGAGAHGRGVVIPFSSGQVFRLRERVELVFRTDEVIFGRNPLFIGSGLQTTSWSLMVAPLRSRRSCRNPLFIGSGLQTQAAAPVAPISITPTRVVIPFSSGQVFRRKKEVVEGLDRYLVAS